MSNPSLLSCEISGTSDTMAISYSNELPKIIFNQTCPNSPREGGGGGEMMSRTCPKTSCKGGGAGTLNLSPPNTPRESGGGVETINLSFPHSPCENAREAETINRTWSNSPNGGGGRGETNVTTPKSPSEQSVESDNEAHEEDPNIILNTLRTKNGERIIIGHLNINHIEKKFGPLVSLVKDRLDIFLLTETKIDQSFPPSQFTIDGYSNPFRRDRDVHGGGLLLYVRDDIPCKEIKVHTLPGNIECLFIEIKLRNKKYILVGGYNPHRDSSSYFLSHIGKALDKLLGDYDNILLLGDFNSTQEEQCMKDFCETYNLDNLIKEPTCFKNVNNPSSIDVMLTNRKNSFQNSITIETGLSDHHKLTTSILKIFFKKKEPRKINYRSYKNFNESNFRNDLKNCLQNCNHETIQYDEFKDIFMKVLNYHAPTKQRVVRGNNQPFMNKTLSKAFMHRSKLKNQYNKYPTESNKTKYKKQRNFCVSLLAKV